MATPPQSDASAPAAATELPKAYDPYAVEAEAYRVWTEERAFHAEPAAGGKPYAIVIPPPNVTAALHLGHALNNTIQDILIRRHRMAGDNACWLPGTDHAGIATQTVVEKRVMQEEGKRRTDFARDEFVARIQAWKDEYERTITSQLKAMGCSCDWDRQAFTMDPPRAKAVREAFFRLFRDGLIYRGKRLVNWDPVTQTALADDEVEMEEVDGNFYYLRYPLVEAGDTETGRQGDKEATGEPSGSAAGDSQSTYITVATTRPETMLGDTAVAINPKDPRAAALRGKRVRLPIVNREIPIVEDDYVVLSVAHGGDPADVKAQFASGFLKVTPAHDPNDYDLGQRHKLPLVNVMAPDASISDKHGWPADDAAKADPFLRESLVGQSREEARKRVVRWFKEKGLLEEVKPYRHSVGHSYRSHVPIEPYLSDQWYCKVTDERLAGAALRAMVIDQREGRSRDREGAEPSAEPSAAEPLPDVRGSFPLAYFITFTTYGSWLHGTDRGSADRDHNIFGAPCLIGDEERERREFAELKHPPASLDEARRRVVLDTIAEVCRHREWTLHVAHVRPTHVHVVMSASAAPEKVMNDFKAYATRRLREAKLVGPEERVWTRHGSTRYLFTDEALVAASDYVHDRQGTPIEPLPLAGADVGLGKSRERERAEASGSEEPLPNGRGSFQGEGTLRFYPARYAKTFQTWHENIRDWCISRQLWWGHRIPVWSGPAEPPISSWMSQGYAAEEEESWDHRVVGDIRYICLRYDDPKLMSEIEAAGFSQDPDVLDTWFSSALWPMSTLQWPADNAALDTWNPSNVLCTAREIITLWVSRMVMFNLYFRDCLPFTDVFIHAMIQDGEGQKMSKTLGNGVDPLDIIASHGADAMRYTLAAMTTHTQDLRMPVDMVDPHTGQTFAPQKITESSGRIVAAPVQASPKDPNKKMVSTYGMTKGLAKPTPDMPLAKNTSSKFDVGRNFCNKIWNAVRFALMNLSAAAAAGDAGVAPTGGRATRASPLRAEPVDESKWSLADRWIVSRFNRTVAEADAALAEYRFDVYAKACYDFFWRDLCDWYLEAIKPAMRDPARAPQTANVLASVLDGALRLMHPAIPFITETIWWRLNDARPARGLPGRLECPPSPRLVRARWPAVGEFAEAAEFIFPKLQEVIGAIRQLRNDRKVKPSQPVTVSILAPGDSARSIAANRELIELLATCALKEVGADVQPPKNAARVAAAGCDVFVEGLVDEAGEQAVNTKKCEDLKKLITNYKARLSNESYTAKAPPHLVQQTRDQLAAAEAEAAKLGCA